jgi:hypothetical protein
MAMAGNDTSKVCPLTFHALGLAKAAGFNVHYSVYCWVHA